MVLLAILSHLGQLPPRRRPSPARRTTFEEDTPLKAQALSGNILPPAFQWRAAPAQPALPGTRLP
jgi:hypothetical protein